MSDDDGGVKMALGTDHLDAQKEARSPTFKSALMGGLCRQANNKYDDLNKNKKRT